MGGKRRRGDEGRESSVPAKQSRLWLEDNKGKKSFRVPVMLHGGSCNSLNAADGAPASNAPVVKRKVVPPPPPPPVARHPLTSGLPVPPRPVLPRQAVRGVPQSPPPPVGRFKPPPSSATPKDSRTRTLDVAQRPSMCALQE